MEANCSTAEGAEAARHGGGSRTAYDVGARRSRTPFDVARALLAAEDASATRARFAIR